MTRYTRSQLIEDLKTYNKQLEAKGSSLRFEYGHRNGYHAIDEYTLGRKAGCVDRNVTCGKPRECATAMRIRYLEIISSIKSENAAEQIGNDPNWQPLEIDAEKCFVGYCVMVRKSGIEYAITSPTITDLRKAFKLQLPSEEMDMSQVRVVKLAQHKGE